MKWKHALLCPVYIWFSFKMVTPLLNVALYFARGFLLQCIHRHGLVSVPCFPTCLSLPFMGQHNVGDGVQELKI